MPDNYYFFFSYARVNYLNSEKADCGDGTNYMEQFFKHLCRKVSDLTGSSPDEVAYRDQNRLKVGEFWDQGLVEGLQKSRVLLSLISPHYLKSHNCGRELAFFNRRLEEHIRLSKNTAAQTHRILPLFWIDSKESMKKASPVVSKFLKRCNFTQPDMPSNYPAIGLWQICTLENKSHFEQLCISLAKRIVELAEDIEPLPELPEQGDFSDLESIYTILEREADENIVISGPVGANVVYAVGTRAELELIDGVQRIHYEEERHRWCPFPESPGATVELLTAEGANSVGFKELRNLDFPDDLVTILKTAKRSNSPVLLILDRSALSLPRIKAGMEGYDTQNFENCGLVTAGGNEVSDDQVRDVFKFKYVPNFMHHIWNVPANRIEYVASVASVLGSIKKQLMNKGQPDTTYSRGTLIGLPSS